VSISSRIEALRKATGRSLEEIRAQLDVSRGMFHYMRSGERNPSRKILERLEAAERQAALAPGFHLKAAKAMADASGGTPEQREETFHDSLAIMSRFLQLVDETLSELADVERRAAQAGERLKAEREQLALRLARKSKG
jgi:transcriptional regulator with XRE-family HTH domain